VYSDDGGTTPNAILWHFRMMQFLILVFAGECITADV
jgi:hypothetical protein